MTIFVFIILGVLCLLMLAALARHIWNAADGQLNIKQTIVVTAILLVASIALIGLELLGRLR